jgi:hypothetical protein
MLLLRRWRGTVGGVRAWYECYFPLIMERSTVRIDSDCGIYIHIVREHDLTKKNGHREEWPDYPVEVE